MAACGTIAGSATHRRRKEPQCDPCRLAWNAYYAKLRTPSPQVPCPGGCGRMIRASAKGCRACHHGPLAKPKPGRPKPDRRKMATKALGRAARGTRGGVVIVEGPCNWCGTRFTSRASQIARFCSRTCLRKCAKARRRGREADAPGQYTWAQVIKLLLVFDHRCAYCNEYVAEPEPDHVVPISRGGANSIHNILPSCHACNSGKKDHLLHEWAAERARRGQTPVVTSWPPDDPRFAHITSVIPQSVAA